MKAAYAQIVDLFVEGTEVDLGPGVSPLWVQKLNQFESDDAARSASLAAARVSNAMREEDSEESVSATAQVLTITDDSLRGQLLAAGAEESFARIAARMRFDPEWTEISQQIARAIDSKDDEAAQEEAQKLNAQYIAELRRRLDEDADDRRVHLESLSRVELERAYVESLISMRARVVYQREFSLRSVYFSARVCKAGRNSTGEWDHKACEHHRERAFDSLDEARSLPDELFTRLLNALNGITVPVADARFSDRQEGSSASSAQPAAPAASPASTPAGTPPVPVAT